MKASAESCANQGLIKYWGKTQERLRLPTNNSISVCLDGLRTRTTVEFSPEHAKDSFRLDGAGRDDERVVRHLDLLRSVAGSKLHARVESRNDFPAGVGMASSASGFAALTVAAAAALDLKLSAHELSRLARRGSGSASRSIPGGFTELLAGDSDEACYATRLASEDALEFRTLVVTVATTPKKVSSTKGMKITTETSPFFAPRLEYLNGALQAMRKALAEKDAAKVAELAEIDTMNMHATMITSRPPLLYWTGGTLDVIREVLALREEGVPAFVSVDAGQNPFVNTIPRQAETVRDRLAKLPSVASVLTCRPGGPAHLVAEHLF